MSEDNLGYTVNSRLDVLLIKTLSKESQNKTKKNPTTTTGKGYKEKNKSRRQKCTGLAFTRQVVALSLPVLISLLSPS